MNTFSIDGILTGRITSTRPNMQLSEFYLYDLPDAARIAYTTPDAEWKRTPQSCDRGASYASYDNDTHRYVRYYIEHGWRVTYHVVEHTVWIIDCDGNWCGDSCSVDNPQYVAFILPYEYPTLEASWGGYYEHVIKTKNDYLNEFIVKNPIELRKVAKKALRLVKKEAHTAPDVREPRLLQSPDGLVHHAIYTRIHLWRTACGHYFPVVNRTESQVLTCLTCIATR